MLESLPPDGILSSQTCNAPEAGRKGVGPAGEDQFSSSRSGLGRKNQAEFEHLQKPSMLRKQNAHRPRCFSTFVA